MIAIVDYGLGNLFSVQKAFQLLGSEAVITSDHALIRSAERIVLPGIGAFGDGMKNLRERGLDIVLAGEVLEHKKPFLGICLGLQLLATRGLEYGNHMGLGWIEGEVRLIDAPRHGLKIPHIGWNDVTRIRESPLFAGIKANADFYFVHSYQLIPEDKSLIIGTAEYGETITAVVQKDNIFATQFHPEKSQEHGLKLLENFIRFNPYA